MKHQEGGGEAAQHRGVLHMSQDSDQATLIYIAQLRAAVRKCDLS